MSGEVAIREAFDRFLRAHVDGQIPRISDVRRATLGRSRENWLFDVTWPDGRVEPLIVRRDPLGGLVETDRTLEYDLLRRLEGAGLPSPQARWLDPDGRWFGRPSLVMRREPGSSDYHVLNSDLPRADRLRLAEAFCDLLADVHAVPWRELGLGELFDDPGSAAAHSEVERQRALLHAAQLEPHPEIELTLAWLSRRAPRAERTVLVHADFKPGNVLLEDGQVRALLDWELAHLGDPLEDLGWVTQPLREREHLIAGAWDREDLVARYAARTGRPVDREALRWWQILATARTAIMQVCGLRAFVEGRAPEDYRPTRKVLSTALRQIAEPAAG